ncbi:MAG: TM0106 family RecB-like putative nuclease [Chloroflexota bacterium]|nr:TM0106 family RecB-like putative nuclease [Chloroflexota bacterium]
MQDLDGALVYSATDLVGYLECEYLTTLERAVFATDLERPDRVDPELQVLQERGIEHERKYLAYLTEQGRTVVDGCYPRGTDPSLTPLERIQHDAGLTFERMRDGADVIYQAALFDGTWLGYADFLLRVDGPDAASGLGSYHYEVADTKLARRVKGSALLQMCVYSDLVSRLQGRMPEHMHVALGGSGHRVESHRLDDYLAYFRSVKARFMAAVAAGQPLAYPLPLTPPPVTHCGVCRWAEYCSGLRREADHLSLVAGMRSDAARRLADAGIGTFSALARLTQPLPLVPNLSEVVLGNLHQQARLQHESRGLSRPLYEFLPVEENRGLAALPERSAGDLFFDMEGDPFAEDEGLEYLFGVWDPPDFRTWWGHSRADEKVAFEGFIDFLMERWQADPGMHVYHYAAYERGRIGMLATRHATREVEVDRILRGELFVDLYSVVRQSLRIGVDSYSIKALEPSYGFTRSVPLKDAGSSVVAYEAYIRSVTAGAPDQSILDQIHDYNRDDCRSNLELREWLEGRRGELEARSGQIIPRPFPKAEERERELTPDDRRRRDLADRLRAAPLSEPDAPYLRLLADLLEWHRREENVEWWAFFDRCGQSDEQLVEDEEAIGQLEWLAEVDRATRTVRHRYRFDPEQRYRLKEGQQPVDPATKRTAGKIVALDALHGTLDLQWSIKHPKPHPTSLVPPGPRTAEQQKGALERLARWVELNGLRGPGPWRAARELLAGLPPRAGQAPGAALAHPGEASGEAARRLVLLLDETALPVQGPPGSGKTWTGAEMILELVRDGRKVGIVASTHRAIENLLDEVLRHAGPSAPVAAIRKVETDEVPPADCGYACTEHNQDVATALGSGRVQVGAGTAWMWSRPEFHGSIDTLFVDEAGQMSLANMVSVCGAARNVVLLGDPQQLSQVKKGAHPEGADASSLEYVLAGEPVIDPTRGIFLAETWRLHPDVNAFTSVAFYKGELRSAPGASRQSVDAPGPITGTGVRWVPVPHAGNHNSSEEEATAMVDLYQDLLAGRWANDQRQVCPITPEDVLVIAPYNAQVELLAERLRTVATSAPVDPREPWVATVDKIQGQQGAVAIYSMATSSQDEMPRSIEFLYSLNRLNVATSRGRCLAIVVASPDLLKVRVHTPLQMRLANALCRFVEVAATQTARG